VSASTPPDGGLPPPFVESVFHPSDFSEASEVAFAHALAIALIRGTELTILHAGGSLQENWRRFPAVRRTLERWGLLEPGSPRRAVFEELSVRVTKINAGGSPLHATLEFVREEEPDLVVLATEGRDGLARWLQPSTAQRIARRTGTMTLFVPAGCRPLVHPADGHLQLESILLPVAHSPSSARASIYATRAAAALGEGSVRITRLHVGDDPFPEVPLPDGAAWSWHEERRSGDPVEQIVAAATAAHLVVMPTDGRDGFLDTFRGSHTERVLHQIDCPLLAVPSL